MTSTAATAPGSGPQAPLLPVSPGDSPPASTTPPGGDLPPLVLVDGHNLLWRAAYGYPPSQDRGGVDRTGAIGFFAMLRGTLQWLRQPSECLVCFDGEHGPAWRQAIDPAYKQRRDNDERPLGGLADVRRGLDAVDVGVLQLDDQEADDLIASVVALAPHRPTTILSADRDFLQLVTSTVRVVNTALPISQRMIGPHAVQDRFGVTPGQWCDFRALTGDAADGLPGVPGVGARRAAQLLEGGLTLEDLEGAGRLTGRIGDAVKAHWAAVVRWRELSRLRNTVPLPREPCGTATPTLPQPLAILDLADGKRRT
jgi:DNA polymerase-1